MRILFPGHLFAIFAPVVHDVLILGRGIAGAVLAETCRQRGLYVHVFDKKQPGNATMAAGGAVNPVVPRRGGLCWGARLFMPWARTFYAAWEEHMGIHVWHEAPLVKLFADAQEAAHWEKAAGKPALRPFITRRPEPEIDQGPFRAPWGYGTVSGAAWLDLPKLLDAQRETLLRGGALTERRVEPGEIREEADGIRAGDAKGRWLVDCTGPFSGAPGLVPVKGETLTVRIPGLRLTRLVHGRTGLLPLGGDLFRAGSTFAWTDVWAGPTAQARDWMLARLGEMLELPMEVVDARAGVRPAARDRKPVLGLAGPRRAVINGLGARGVMQAPWCAAHLLDHLFGGKPLDAEVDAMRYTA